MQIAVTIFLDGLITASYLFIVAVGLTMVFGVMKILNVAHGALYASGAYGAAYLIQSAAKLGYPDWVGFILIPIAAVVAGSLIGFVLERGILKRLYGQDEVTVLLATFALFLVLEDTLHIIFGTQAYQAYQPMLYLGDVKVAGVHRDLFSGLLIIAASSLAIIGWGILRFTRHGRLVKAVVFDREVSEAMGTKVGKIFTRTFVIGCILGAFGGACVAPLYLGDAGHQRRNYRDFLCGCCDRWHGQYSRSGAGRARCRIYQSSSSSLVSTRRTLRGLRGDGSGPQY